MNIKLVYISPNGTTRRISEIIKDVFEKNGHFVQMLDIGSKEYREDFNKILIKLKESDIIGFGSPAYHMDMLELMKKLIKAVLQGNNPDNFKVFFYLSYGGITSGKAFINAVNMFNKKHVPIIGGVKIMAPHFHHNDKLPEESIKELIGSFYSKLQNKGFSPIAGDRLSSVFSPRKKRVNLLYPFTHFISKRRELKICLTTEMCKCCGKCERECPAGAIRINCYADIDFSKCIHCYHCTVACKFNAIKAPVEKLDDMIRVNKKIIGMEKPQNHIYF